MKEFRGGIIRMFEQGKSGYQIAQDMNLHERTFNRIIKRYQETESYSDRQRSGRPRTARTLANKRKIKGRIQRSPEACSKPHQSIEALKKSLVKAWNAIPQDIIDKAVDDFPKRLKKCIEAGGIKNR
uniref:Tc3 transposase DNA binding domain-containing protein n=1 Tax=Acrobeloides nanus TaxID=290746 RepID=A0A914DRZ2_9BILA